MVLAAAGDTWGISSTTFLIGYAALALVVLAMAVRARRALADPSRKVPTPDLTTRPNDTAYLNGGGDLAVCSALASLRLRGLVQARKGTISATGRPDGDELERAIMFVTTSPVPRSRLSWQRPVRTALEGIDRRLVAEGLLLSAETRRRIRSVGLWMVAVAAVGFARILAGITGARPIGYLVVEFGAVLVITAVLFAKAPRRTRTGDRLLAAMRSDLDRYAPTQRPDWTVYGASAAALGVGLYGASALWASDPAMAEELAVQRMSGAGGGDGGSSWGGGDSSSCGGGGGGGCGGGGGGCGGS